MLQQKEFMQWFEKEVKVRWAKCHFEWTEMGDWHWRLRAFDTDTLTEAVRQHKTTEDWRAPSVKKVHEYAKTIQMRNSPKRERRDDAGVPEAHTYIMCVSKDDNGRGTVGWFVPILLWPFRTKWKPDDYAAVAEQQRLIHARRGGIWEIFTHTTHGDMLKRRCDLLGIQPLDLNQLRKRYKTEPRQ